VITQRIRVGAAIEVVVDIWHPAAPATGTGMLLVHGLASNARLWDGVAARLAELGHPAAAIDLRGHGRSDKPESGYDLPSICADLVEALGSLATGEGAAWGRPVVVGQSWGGNVVLELAFREPGLTRGIACVDGGIIDLAARFGTWEECVAVLAPPRLAGMPGREFEARIRNAHPTWPDSGIRATMANVEVRADGTIAPWLSFEHHLLVLRGLWEHRPPTRYRGIPVPVLLIPADDGEAGSTAVKRDAVTAALGAIPTARAHWFSADHDIHAQYPDQLATVLHEAATDGFFS
jgi:pimeloyl-ACP methyl ester carboxylesterase